MATSGAVPAGYTVVSELGSGRVGRAVLCKDAADRSVVVRLTGITGERAPLLEAELRTVAAAASHPCAVAIPKVWTDPELGVCFEQVHCPGVAQGPVSAEAAAVGGVRLAAALAHSHRLGLLHGDLRPDDVMLDAEGSWLLADGGVLDAIRRARPELAVERDSLFSPRELRGWEPPAESADVYSLGATLRALLGDTAVDAAMDGLLGRMLAPNPADRPSLVEVDEVLRAAVPAAAQAGLPLRPEGARPAPVPPRPAIRLADAGVVPAAGADRRKMLVAAGAIGAVFVVAAGGVAIANSGSDHGGATAAAATASLTPNVEYFKPLLHESRWRPAIAWHMAAGSPVVQGWRIYAVDPNNYDSVVSDGFFPLNGVALPEGKAVQWFLGDKVALTSCARVDTIYGTKPYPSSVFCPGADLVAAAQAANAQLDKAAAQQSAAQQAAAQAAAKKAAAKKAAAKKAAAKKAAAKG